MRRAMMYVACVFATLTTQVRAAETIVEPRYGVDMPTAGVLRRGEYAMTTQMYRGGGLTAGLSVGIFDRMMFGISFGGNGIIGVGDVTWQKIPGIVVKYRIIDETVFPAFALGFDSQGNEGYNADKNRYTVKSPGFYVAASKNYTFFGYLSFHGCLNYSLENEDGKIPDLTLAAEKSVGDNVAMTAEYDLALNDHNNAHFGRDRGYFNMGVRWHVGGGLSLEADVKNIFGNQDGVPAASRVIRIEYVSSLR